MNDMNLGLPATPAAASDWTAACRDAGVDPAEVRVVLGRYRAYANFYADGRRGQPLALEQWFGFYHAEQESEHGSTDVIADGCSVDPSAAGRAVLRKPREFLHLLKAAHESL